MQKQSINTSDDVDRDVFGYAVDKGWMCVQILYMRQGKLIERHATSFPYYGEEYEDFISFVSQYYSENPALPKEVLLPSPPAEEQPREAASPQGRPKPQEKPPVDGAGQTSGEQPEASGETDGGERAAERGAEQSGKDVREALEAWLRIKVRTPRRGAKKKMVDMACDNARVALEEKFRLIERDEERTVHAAANLGEWLGTGPVHRIEAFDNSNIQGAHPVSAMVVFIDGKPERKEYRKYKIRTVQGPDDYSTMREVIRRRYERVLKEHLPLPDLIIVDGGRGQISAAVDVLENELGLFIPVGGLVKDEKHRTAQLMVGDPPAAVPLPRDSQAFYLLQRIQEEVHRFAVTFHRETRAKSMVASQLDAIPGIGEKRRKLLLKHFGSIRKIREAAVEDFRPLGIGEKLAREILRALRDESPQPASAAAGSAEEK